MFKCNFSVVEQSLLFSSEFVSPGESNIKLLFFHFPLAIHIEKKNNAGYSRKRSNNSQENFHTPKPRFKTMVNLYNVVLFCQYFLKITSFHDESEKYRIVPTVPCVHRDTRAEPGKTERCRQEY